MQSYLNRCVVNFILKYNILISDSATVDYIDEDERIVYLSLLAIDLDVVKQMARACKMQLSVNRQDSEATLHVPREGSENGI